MPSPLRNQQSMHLARTTWHIAHVQLETLDYPGCTAPGISLTGAGWAGVGACPYRVGLGPTLWFPFALNPTSDVGDGHARPAIGLFRARFGCQEPASFETRAAGAGRRGSLPLDRSVHPGCLSLRPRLVRQETGGTCPSPTNRREVGPDTWHVARGTRR